MAAKQGKQPRKEAGGWPEPATPVATIRLSLGDRDADASTLRNLSAATRVGGSLFLAGDERPTIERLTETHSGWGDHACFRLGDLLDLDDAEAEADIEGLAVDEEWLWVLGSHARTRPKPDKSGGRIDLAGLADLKDTRPRCLLARLPLAEDLKTPGALCPVSRDGDRRAGMLRQKKSGNHLAKVLRRDPLLEPFTRVPAKEGGIDIEGIAVCGERVALGMRGPVIATYALLLELEVEAKPSGRLRLSAEPVKRLLALEGLGIRDLKRCGADLLILAGPTAGLGGPCALYCWRGWADDPPRDPQEVRVHRPERLFDLPFGRGGDHPEGLALWGENGGAERILVVYDSPTKRRLKGGAIEADLFSLAL
jgi:hypothetical protein